METVIIKEEFEDSGSLLEEDLDEVILRRMCQANHENVPVREPLVPGSAAGSPFKLEPQEVIWTDGMGSAIKQEPLEGADKADPLLVEDLEPINPRKCDRVCQEDDCDSECWVPGPRHLEGSPVRLQTPPWSSRTDTDELIIPGTLEGCDEMCCSDHNSSQPHVGYAASEKQGLGCLDQAQGADRWAATEQGDAQHHDSASSLGTRNSFLCDLCKRMFRRKTTLRMHISAHTRTKPYRCRVCNKRFSWPSNLTTHSRIHSGLKPYRCLVCHKQFSDSSNLITHSRLHSGLKPYQCEVCSKEFTHSSHLTTHSRIHSGLKPYQCPVCHKQFSRSSSLTRHSRTHSGLRPYRCQLCNKYFSDSSSLTRHSRTHSEVETISVSWLTQTVQAVFSPHQQ